MTFVRSFSGVALVFSQQIVFKDGRSSSIYQILTFWIGSPFSLTNLVLIMLCWLVDVLLLFRRASDYAQNFWSRHFVCTMSAPFLFASPVIPGITEALAPPLLGVFAKGRSVLILVMDFGWCVGFGAALGWCRGWGVGPITDMV